MANIHRADGEGAPRPDRRGHDGLQGGVDGDRRRFATAVDWLRKKGLSKAAKKAGRIAAEGLIGIALAPGKGVDRRGQFRDRFRGPQRHLPGPGEDDRPRGLDCRHRRRGAAQARTPELRRSPTRSRRRSPRSARTSRCGAPHRWRWRPAGSNSMCTTRCPRASARSACWSRLKSRGKPDQLAALGRNLAMHVAASQPQALDAAGLDPAVVRAREGRAGGQGQAAGQARGTSSTKSSNRA